jgi:hypothetical protein
MCYALSVWEIKIIIRMQLRAVDYLIIFGNIYFLWLAYSNQEVGGNSLKTIVILSELV